MIYPNFLKEHDTIGVSAPSDGVSDSVSLNRLDSAIQNFRDLGYFVIETKNVRSSLKGRSSSSIEQARELETLFLNDDVAMIFCACGGDFLVEMLSYFNFQKVLDHPKWLQGYSDPTGLLFVITTNFDVATIYGSNFKEFGMVPWHSSLQNNLEILKGNMIKQENFDRYEGEYLKHQTGLEAYRLTKNVFWSHLNKEEEVHLEGRVIGGCIDVLSEIFGTKYDKTIEFIEKYQDDGIIWYFDHCELSSEALIRTLWKFQESGWFRYCHGIIFGRSMMEASYYGISLEEALHHSLDPLQVPVIFNADIGHVAPRLTMINGAKAQVFSKNGKGEILFELK